MNDFIIQLKILCCFQFILMILQGISLIRSFKREKLIDFGTHVDNVSIIKKHGDIVIFEYKDSIGYAIKGKFKKELINLLNIEEYEHNR